MTAADFLAKPVSEEAEPRVSSRLHSLRGWSRESINEVSSRGPGAFNPLGRHSTLGQNGPMDYELAAAAARS